jgi:hypothetical protein
MQKLQEKPSALKREHPALQKMKILFSLLVGHFALLDSGPATQINADADPQPCEHECVLYSQSFILATVITIPMEDKNPVSVFIKEMKKAHEMKKVKALSFQLDDDEEDDGEEDDGHKDEENDDDNDDDDDDDKSKGKKMNSEQRACCKIVSFQSFRQLFLSLSCLY